jgi:hypothetical protein
VTVFNGANLAILESFNAFTPSFAGGVYVAFGEVNGVAEIVTGAGAGGGPQIAVFGGAGGALLQSFYASNPNPTDVLTQNANANSGVRVGTTTANGQLEILAGPGQGPPPVVDIFNGQSLALLDSFFAYDPSFRGDLFVGG